MAAKFLFFVAYNVWVIDGITKFVLNAVPAPGKLDF